MKNNRLVWAIRIWLFAKRCPPYSNADNSAARRKCINPSLAIFQVAERTFLSDAPGRCPGQGRSAFRYIGKSYQSPKSKTANWCSALFDKLRQHYRRERCRTNSTFYRALGKIRICSPLPCRHAANKAASKIPLHRPNTNQFDWRRQVATKLLTPLLPLVSHLPLASTWDRCGRGGNWNQVF